MKLSFVLILLVLSLGVLACGDTTSRDDDLRANVEVASDAFAAELISDRPADVEAYNERLLAYYEANPDIFGAGLVLHDQDGNITNMLYVHDTDDGYINDDFYPSYSQPELQEWYTAPLEANAGIWTAPYFDAGGGEIWMISRSVPLRDATGIFALVVTDLPVDAP